MKEYLVNFLEEFEYPQEAKPDIIKACDLMLENENMKNALVKAYDEYKNNTIDWDETAKNISELSDEIKIHKFTALLVYFLIMSKHTRVLYEERNLPYNLFKETFMDFNYKIKQCYDSDKVWGVACYTAWFTWFYTLERFAFGRLQFEIKPFRGKEPYTKHNITLNPETPVINIHIPASGPLYDEEVENAFARAYEFFKKDFPNGYLPIMCHSWLLFPEHKNMLSENSNIYRFMSKFDPLFTDYFENYDVPFSVLYHRGFNGDLSSYNADNSLKRGYHQLIKDNKPCGTTCGILLYFPK